MNEKRRNIAIGSFVVGAGLILLTLVLFISSGGLSRNTEKAIVVFDGSIKGLRVGAPLAFKGVQIGSVTKIDLVINTNTFDVMMPVEVQYGTGIMKEVGARELNLEDDDKILAHLIKRGMRAQLQQQSLLTGLLYVQLDFHPGTKINLAEIDSELPQFPTIPTDLEKISRNLQDFDLAGLLDHLSAAVAGLDQFINDPEVKKIAVNLNATLESIEALSNQVTAEVEQASPGLNSLIANTDSTMQALGQATPKVSGDLRAALADASSALASIENAMQTVDYSLSDDSAAMYDIRTAAQELAAASRAVKTLADALEEQPESLLKGKSPLE